MWTWIGILFMLSLALYPYWLFLYRFFTGDSYNYPAMGGNDSEGTWLGIIFVISFIILIIFGIIAMIANSPLVIIAIIGIVLQPLQWAIVDSSTDYPSLKKEIMETIIKFNESQKR